MENRMKTGAAALTLAVIMSGCAPVPGTTAGTPTGNTTGYGVPVNNGTTVASNTNTTGYDYGYGGSNANTSYDYYSGTTGTTGGANTNTTYYDYTAPTGSSGSSSGYTYDYSAGGSTPPANATNPTGGRYAVQVVASPNRATADAMVSQMRGMGYNAVLDTVGGMYKVRVPFNTESEARNALYNIRGSVGDAFYTTR